MIGNVWEWTTDWHSDHHPPEAEGLCCVPRNPQGGLQAYRFSLHTPARLIAFQAREPMMQSVAHNAKA